MQTERVYIADGYGLEACLVNDAALNFRHEYVQRISIYMCGVYVVYMCVYTMYICRPHVCVCACVCVRAGVSACMSVSASMYWCVYMLTEV